MRTSIPWQKNWKLEKSIKVIVLLFIVALLALALETKAATFF